MADYEGAKPVQTIRDNEFKIILVDGESGTSATKKLTIIEEGVSLTGKYGVPSIWKDSSGNAIIPTLNAGGGLPMTIVDSDGDELLITDDGEANVYIPKAMAADGATAPAEVVVVGGVDGSGNAQAMLTDTSGRPTVIVAERGSAVCDFQTSAAVGAGSTATHDYDPGNGNTLYANRVLVGAKGRVKVQIGIWNGVDTFTPKFTYFQDPKENLDHDISDFEFTGDGTQVARIIITNEDGQGSDVYSTLQGRLV